jgi:hypothetical protein
MTIYSWYVFSTEKGGDRVYVGCKPRHWLRIKDHALIRNPIRKCWHIADFDTGAIIHSCANRTEARQAARLLQPFLQETKALLAHWATTAKCLPEDEFFNLFGTFEARPLKETNESQTIN